MRVPCDIYEEEMEGSAGPVDGILAVCQRCGHQTKSFGTSEKSVRRCLALMREKCPENEENFYVDADEDEDEL